MPHTQIELDAMQIVWREAEDIAVKDEEAIIAAQDKAIQSRAAATTAWVLYRASRVA